MSSEQYRMLLLSDFNLENLAALIEQDGSLPDIDPLLGPYGQACPVLLDENHDTWEQDPDYLLCWTKPENVIGSFNNLQSGSPVSIDELLNEVDGFISQIRLASQKVKAVFLPTWTQPPYSRGMGMLDFHPDNDNPGVAFALQKMNLHLAEKLAGLSNVYLLDAQRWISLGGSKGWNPGLWYMAKIAFGNNVFIEAIKDIKAAIRGIEGTARKLIILDLDDTLWGGIVGDAGWENLVLGGHDPMGEAFVHFQQRLKAITQRGVVLGIVSKNESEVALEAIDKHPEMVLKRDDFAGWRINWEDKAANIVSLVEELNLGLQSAVFIDDNPAERARVAEMLPEVIVPDWPKDPMKYVSKFESLALFDLPSLSKEDRERTASYTAERKRTELREKVTSPEEWLASMEVTAQVEEYNDANLARIVQLINKTNQMNLTTRRLTENELLEWLNNSDLNRQLWSVRVSDKFGDSGLTGIISVEVDGTNAKVVDFILSCRVFGRKIEDVLFSVAGKNAGDAGAKEVNAEYLETKKNRPCLRFLENSGLERLNNIFSWNLSKEFPVPGYIEVVQ